VFARVGVAASSSYARRRATCHLAFLGPVEAEARFCIFLCGVSVFLGLGLGFESSFCFRMRFAFCNVFECAGGLLVVLFERADRQSVAGLNLNFFIY
jgi:hypothetical protein